MCIYKILIDTKTTKTKTMTTKCGEIQACALYKILWTQVEKGVDVVIGV